MAIIYRPNGDQDKGDWQPTPGGPNTLWTEISENLVNNSNFMFLALPAASHWTYKGHLAAQGGSDPFDEHKNYSCKVSASFQILTGPPSLSILCHVAPTVELIADGTVQMSGVFANIDANSAFGPEIRDASLTAGSNSFISGALLKDKPLGWTFTVSPVGLGNPRWFLCTWVQVDFAEWTGSAFTKRKGAGVKKSVKKKVAKKRVAKR